MSKGAHKISKLAGSRAYGEIIWESAIWKRRFIRNGNNEAQEMYFHVSIIGPGHGRLERGDHKVLFRNTIRLK